MGLFPPTKYLVQRGKSMMSGLTKRLQRSVGILYLILTLSFASSAFPQGILTVTPGRSVATVAGTGALGEQLHGEPKDSP